MARRMKPLNSGNGVINAINPPKAGAKPKVKKGKDLRTGK